MDRRFKTNKLASALALCGIALFSIHANAAYVFRVAVPGLKPEAGLSISPSNFNFGNVNAGQTASSNFVISNIGGQVVTAIQYQINGPFTLSGNCGTSLAPGAQCTEAVTFAPTAGQSYSGTLTATNGSVSSSAALVGTGLLASASVNPSALNFGNQAVATTSAAQTVTLTNNGNSTLSVGQVSASGNFAETSGCGATLAVNASCLINVTFTPQVVNTNSGTLSIVTGTGTKTVSLSGTGQQAILGASPSSLSFGNVVAGTSSTAQNFTLSNTGNIAATGLTFSVPSGYAQTNTCGSTLAANSSCTGTVTFSPTTAAAANGQVSISSSNAAATSVAVTGTGTSAILSASALSFGTVNDYSSTTQSLTITNSGTADASPTFSSSNSAYSVSGCTTVPAGGTCTATVTLATTGAGSYASTLTINGSTSGPVTSNLSGTSQKVIQSFTATGPTTWTVPARLTQLAVLVVGGGGGPEASGGTGTGQGGNGGGGGQVVYNAAYTVTPGASVALTVGAGGDVGQDSTEDGTASTFGTLSAAGGLSGYEGGTSGNGYAGGTGCTTTLQGGGGGGAGGAGSPGGTNNGGAGGPGVANSITGSVVYYGAGGGGGTDVSTGTPGASGTGGTGIGGTPTVAGGQGAANTGGGSGGGGGGGRGNGAAGVVIISY